MRKNTKTRKESPSLYSETYRKWLRQLLELVLKRPDMVAVDMSITNSMNKISRNKICTTYGESKETFRDNTQVKRSTMTKVSKLVHPGVLLNSWLQQMLDI